MSVLELLPSELFNSILGYLCTKDLSNILSCNKDIHNTYSEYLWKDRFVSKYGNVLNYWNGSWEFLCSHIRLQSDLKIFESFRSLITGIRRGRMMSKKSKKIQCKNSYQRRLVHRIAEHLGMEHRSILDYTQIHICHRNQKHYDSGCCPDCDGYVCDLTPQPLSYVEIGSGMEKIVIGNPNTLPDIRYGSCLLLYGYKREILSIKMEHERKVKELA
ncbi:F-box domain-containing protein with RH3 domain [Orpheovirus IHUMI-LCC2]|uniref:F-box domain-containing protein with RH3 domain n=1 Tax=Orpheovirus IHUMI-LCC2 TaxID=2023057 RepID=A0A2I2L441_9VIRU|nr:F-box domain-containing protein with RH3 domain [Orpheovirus IHUMI-LCC2]SNW62293.1 F-box domain-containing protein with RH3 domain [Orpheovirus IHUMI-LCC2]